MKTRKPNQPVCRRERVAPAPAKPPAPARGKTARKPAAKPTPANRPRKGGLQDTPEKANSKKVSRKAAPSPAASVRKPKIPKAAATVSRPVSKPPADPGRKSLYSPELADRICILVSEGVSWRELERRGIVSKYSLAVWLRDHKDFHEKYSRAREARAEWIVAKMEDILDGLAGEDTTHVHVNATRLRLETLKWQVSCYYPRMYGNRVSVDGNVKHEQVKDSGRRYDWTRLSQAQLLTLKELMDLAVVADDD